ncbi:MAG: Sugar-specific transcriptional regulator TrmB [bacterium ADurb.Bin400]|nr:MAG: Sugar-specific transcriptional regulator TrmB [bacterium ADurb.Bin400]
MMTSSNYPELIKSLSFVGLDNDRAAVYLACLEIGPSPIWDIHQKSGVKRPTCYVILDELANAGIAHKASDGKRTIFSVCSPRDLLRQMEEKKQGFSQCLSQLEAIASKSLQKPEISQHEGVEGVRSVYDAMLNLPMNDSIAFYSAGKFELAYSNYFKECLTEWSKKSIDVRGLMPATAEAKLFIGECNATGLTELRHIPYHRFFPKVDTYIFGDSIAHIAYGDHQPFVTITRSPSLILDERDRFEIIWESANR